MLKGKGGMTKLVVMWLGRVRVSELDCGDPGAYVGLNIITTKHKLIIILLIDSYTKKLFLLFRNVPISVFYAEFMNKQWSNHLQYNLEWQKRNFKIIFLTAIVFIQSLLGSLL